MNPIYIHFESFAPGINSNEYVQHALKGLSDYYAKIGGEEFAIDVKNQIHLAQNICNDLVKDEIPTANSSNFPVFDDFYQKRIEIMISCAKDIINEVAPLLSSEGDVIFKESYLHEDWKEFSKSCGVITRKSNYAKVNFLFPDTTIGQEGTVNKEFSNYPGAQKKAMKRSASNKGYESGVQELMNSFVL